MHDQPNIILIITDQQRWDTIGSLGAPWMKTPHLDRMATEGTAFTHCFTTSPLCVSARASLFSGCYPHMLNVYHNFDPWEPTWVSSLAQAGYHCVNIGKMHINPYDAKGGFHQRFVVENKDRALFLEEAHRAIYDEWDKALLANGVVKPSRFTRHAADPEGFMQALGAFEWELPERLFSDNFIADTALWWLEQRKASNPLFLQIGFCGPHPPYDPPRRYIDMYQDVDLPVPEVTQQEIDAQTPALQAYRKVQEMLLRLDRLALAGQPRGPAAPAPPLRGQCHTAGRAHRRPHGPARQTGLPAQCGGALQLRPRRQSR